MRARWLRRGGAGVAAHGGMGGTGERCQLRRLGGVGSRRAQGPREWELAVARPRRRGHRRRSQGPRARQCRLEAGQRLVSAVAVASGTAAALRHQGPRRM